MRKKEKELQDRSEIDAVIRKADVCRLGLSVDDHPYIVPLNFGFDGECLYFHTAGAGKKIDMIRRNNIVCFEMDADCQVVRAENPCDWTMKFRSVTVDKCGGKAEGPGCDHGPQFRSAGRIPGESGGSAGDHQGGDRGDDGQAIRVLTGGGRCN